MSLLQEKFTSVTPPPDVDLERQKQIFVDHIRQFGIYLQKDQVDVLPYIIPESPNRQPKQDGFEFLYNEKPLGIRFDENGNLRMRIGDGWSPIQRADENGGLFFNLQQNRDMLVSHISLKVNK
ncbi:MAG TPA: hypothetical protein VL401_03860 [Alphaproteobacteria bacterium]|jgi:hypothetical protein|nr:hypothetical protein [Alphaproteobacteria bacterium]